MPTWKPITDFQRGDIVKLLQACYANIWNPQLCQTMKQFDAESFDHINTIGACVFFSCLNDVTIGLASYDPRQGPDLGIVGHNCVLPEYQGRGYGREQIFEILRRLRSKNFQKVQVSTGQDPFFLPAQKMYLSCGFREIKRTSEINDHTHGKIYYEKML